MTTPAPHTAVVPTDPAPPSAPAPVVAPPPPPVVVLPAFGPQWPGPGRTAHAAVLVATLVTAVVAAGFLGWDRPGVGWLVTGLVGAVAVTVVAFVGRPAGADQSGRSETGHSGQTATHRNGPTGDTVWRIVWTVLALALLCAGALRAAEWLWLLCVPASALCGAMALAGGRRLRALFMAVVAIPIAVFRSLPWAARGLAAIRGRTTSSALRIAAAVLVTLVLLLVFGALLVNADAVFASVVERVLPTVDGVVVARWIWNFGLVVLGTLAACFLALRPPTFDGDPDANTPTRRPGGRLGRLEWGVPVGALVVLFGAFVAIGAAASFGGDTYVQRTANLTYAEYARQGFWQLLAVTLLTLGVLAIAAKVARRDSAADRLWIRILLGALAVLTLVIVASALSRMSSYEQAYGFTVLRLLVMVCEAWLGLVFVLVLVAGVRLRAPWLPRVVLATAALALVAIVGANPDHLIATQNVDRFQRLGRIDLYYLEDLSADAVPALNRLPADMRQCVLADIDRHLDSLGPDEPRNWNLGRAQARQILDGYAPPPVWYPTCTDVYDRGE